MPLGMEVVSCLILEAVIVLFYYILILDLGQNDFKLIFSEGPKIHLLQSDGPHHRKDIATLSAHVTSLAVYKDHLYVSEYTEPHSTIWHRKLTGLDYFTNFERNDRHGWKSIFKVPCEVSCMVAKKDYFLAGCTDGSIRRYAADDTITIGKFRFPVTGIDYNCADKRFYASLKNGTLLRCSPNIVKSCKKIYDFVDDQIKTVKFEFGALWIATTKARLWKCFIQRVHYNSEDHGVKCVLFYKHRGSDNDINFIGVSYNKLYVNVDSARHILKCKPDQLRSCRPSIEKFFTMNKIAIENRKKLHQKFTETVKKIIDFIGNLM